MEFLVVDGEFAHLWSDSLSRLLFQTFLILFVLQSLTHLHYPRRLGGREGIHTYSYYKHFNKQHTHIIINNKQHTNSLSL